MDSLDTFAAATVGLLGREGDLLRKTILVTMYYALAAGIVAFLLIYGLGSNARTIMLVLPGAGPALVDAQGQATSEGGPGRRSGR